MNGDTATGREARIAERRRMVEAVFTIAAEHGYQYARTHRFAARRHAHLPERPVLEWDEAGELQFKGWGSL